ncbi:MAG: hypothetical protein PHY48_11090 [Candidatus Cloacimonetes bacterium]|nr:hypothetical protein [Candidatus Cloacimonadota bacterium]
MLKVELKGADSIVKKLDSIARKAEQLNGEHSVPINDLFTAQFMRSNTRFSSINEMLEAGGFNIDSQADLKEVPNDDLDCLVRKETDFNNWDEMLHAASEQWISKQLGF